MSKPVLCLKSQNKETKPENNKFALKLTETFLKQGFLFCFESDIWSVSRSEDGNQTSVLYNITLSEAEDPNPAWHLMPVPEPLSVTFRCIKMLVLGDLGGQTAVKYSVITKWMWWGIVI